MNITIVTPTPVEDLVDELRQARDRFSKGKSDYAGNDVVVIWQYGRILLRHCKGEDGQRLLKKAVPVIRRQLQILLTEETRAWSIRLAECYPDLRALINGLIALADVQPTPDVQPVQPGAAPTPTPGVQPAAVPSGDGGRNGERRILGRDGKTYPRRADPQLPERIRSLHAADLTIREIAAELGCSVGTVHRHLHNA